MSLWDGLTLLMVSVISGIKSAYGTALWREDMPKFSRMWAERGTYVWMGVWLLLYFLAGFCFEKSDGTLRSISLFCTYGIAAAIDGKRRIVSDGILGCYFLEQTLLGIRAVPFAELVGTALGGLGFTVLLFAAAWFSKGKIGQGDVRILGVTAMTAGCGYTVRILMTAIFFSFLYSIYLLVIKKKSIQTEFPFIPFLTVGMVVHMAVSAGA